MRTDIFDFRLESTDFFLTVLRTSGFGLIMIKFHVRIIDDQMAVAPHFQAEIYIIKCYREFFCKAACFQENIFFHHHAGSCHTAHILQKGCFMQISGTFCRHIYKHMSRNAAHSHHTACMLDGIIRIDQFGPDSSYFLSLADTKH